MPDIILYGAGKNAHRNFPQWYKNGLRPICFADAEIGKQHMFFTQIPPINKRYEVLSLVEAIKKYPNYLLYLTQSKSNLLRVTAYLIEFGIPIKRLRYCREFQIYAYHALLELHFMRLKLKGLCMLKNLLWKIRNRWHKDLYIQSDEMQRAMLHEIRSISSIAKQHASTEPIGDSSIIFYGAGRNAYRNFPQWYKLGLRPVCFADAEIGKHHTFFALQNPISVNYEILPLFDTIKKYPNYLLYLTQSKSNLSRITTYLFELGIPAERIRYCEGFQEPAFCGLLEQHFIHVESYPPNKSLYTHCPTNNVRRVNFVSNGNFESDYKHLLEYTSGLKSLLKKGYYTRCGDCARKEHGEYTKPLKYEFELASGIKGCDICNFNCIYCGYSAIGAVSNSKGDNTSAEPDGRYDLREMLNHIESNYNSNEVGLTFGAGEISVAECKDDLLEIWNRNNWTGYIASNASYFLPGIASLLEKKLIVLCTSLDSGTSETFAKIKNVDAFKSVTDNLRRYAETGGDIWVKYVVVEGVNDNEKEMDNFISLVSELYKKNNKVIAVLSRDFRVNHHHITPQEVKAFKYMREKSIELDCKSELKIETFTSAEINEIMQ